MTIHFAAARSGVMTILGFLPSAVPVGLAANDNANDNACDLAEDVVLRAALRHFAQYGLGAAGTARDMAEAAFLAGDRNNYHHWLKICRALNSRMANSLRARAVSIDDRG